MVAAGWLLDRRFGLDMKSLVKLNLYLFVPAFIFVNLIQSRVSGGEALRVCGFTFAVILAMMGVSHALAAARRWGTPRRKALQLATMFYNSGNYGIPLMILAYPGLGPRLQVFVLAAMNLATFTLGVMLASSEGPRDWRRLLPLLRQISLWAIAAAVIVRAAGWPVETVKAVWIPLVYLKEGLIAVALVTLGAQLSQTAHRWELMGPVAAALGIRLILGPVIGWGLVRLFGFEGEAAAVLVLSTAVPTAVNTVLVAHEFKADAEFAAAAVFYSTLASAVTVTLPLAVLQG